MRKADRLEVCSMLHKQQMVLPANSTRNKHNLAIVACILAVAIVLNTITSNIIVIIVIVCYNFAAVIIIMKIVVIITTATIAIMTNMISHIDIRFKYSMIRT